MAGENEQLGLGFNQFSSIDEIQRRLASEEQKKEQRFTDLLKEATTRNTTMTPSQGVALSALAALPLLVGRHLSGRTPGATALDAGKLGMQSVGQYTQGIQADDALRRQAAEAEARNVAGDLNIMRSQNSALPGMFIRNKLQGEQEQQRFENEKILLGLRRKAEAPDPARLATIEELRNAAMEGKWGTPEYQKKVAGLTEDETKNIKGVIDLRNAQQMADIRGDTQASKKFVAPILVQVDPNKPLPPDKLRAEAAMKASEIVSLRGYTDRFADAYRRGDKEEQKAVLVEFNSALKNQKELGGAVPEGEVKNFLGAIPKLVELGDFSEGAMQRFLGLDPIKLMRATSSVIWDVGRKQLRDRYNFDIANADSYESPAGKKTKEQVIAEAEAILKGG